MKINITNGEATIKDVYTRATAKAYNAKLSEGTKLSAGQSGEAQIEGFSIDALDRANDALLLNMVEKIVINEEEKSVSVETFDELSSEDVNKILAEIDKLSGNTDKKK